MKKKTLGLISDTEKLSDSKMLTVVAIKSGDFGNEGLIPNDELTKCYKKINGLPIFYSHQRTEQDRLGEVVDVILEDEEVLAKLRLYDETPTQKKVINHIERGNITNVSLGFKTSAMPLFGDKELLFDIEPEELSIVAPYPFDEAVCESCKIVEKNFSFSPAFFLITDEELLLSHLVTHLESNDSRHDTVVLEITKRDMYH